MNNIKHYRKQANLTQAQLGKLIGFEQGTIAHYEAGIRKPSIDVCRLLVRALKGAGIKVNLDDLFPDETETA